MKRTFLFLTLCLLLGSATALATTAAVGHTAILNSGDETLLLHVKLPDVKTLKSIRQPVFATKSVDRIDLQFVIDVSVCSVVVTNNQNQPVYEGAIDTASDRTLTIGTAGWDSGNYSISITTAAGMVWEGDFIL